MYKFLKVALLAAMLGSVFAGWGAVRVYAANLVANGGFESGLWADRTGAGFSIDTTVKHSGNQSLKITAASSTQHIDSATIPVRPYEGYRLSVWVRSDLADGNPVISVNLLPCTEANQALPWYPGGQLKLIQAGGGRQNWTEYTATVTDLPAATAKVKIYLRVDGGASGSVWFDDVMLESMNMAPDGGFESGLWSHNNGFTRDTAESHSGLASAKIVGQSSTRTMYTDPIPVLPGEQYTFSLWIKTDGISTSDGINVSVLRVDSANQALGWYGGNVKLRSTGGTQDWTKVEVELSGLSAATAYLRLYVRCDAGVAGTAWFDDVRLNKQYRDNYVWGITGHSKSRYNYSLTPLANQMQKGADLGIGYYRIGTDPVIRSDGTYDWTYLDEVVDTAYDKGLKVYLTIYASLGLSPAVLEQRAEDLASRYQGKIAYYQLGNENDLKCILGAQYDGSSPSHYDSAAYADVRDKLIALSTGIRSGDPYAKRVLNMTWKHTAFLEMLNDDGVEWEVTGLDWYSNMGSATSTLNKLQTYPQPEILIAEVNTRNGTYTATEQEQADYITQTASEFYYDAPSKVNGYMVYELLDEPAHAGGEGHYGLVYNTGGMFGPDKLAYGAYQTAIANKR